MGLQDYTTEELKAELKLRYYARKKEQEKVMRCRHCKHCIRVDDLLSYHICGERTWGKNIKRHYRVFLSNKACELFEKKGQEDA